MTASGVISFSVVEYSAFACLGLATLASIGQGIILIPEFDPVLSQHSFEKQRYRLILLGVTELTLLTAVIVLSAVENVQERAEYQTIFWLAWVAFAVELLELASETLAHVVKVEDHHKLRTGFNREFRADPRSRRVRLRRSHRWGFRFSVLVVFVSVALSATFIVFCFFRQKGSEACDSRAVSSAVLGLWSVTAALCASIVFSSLLLAKRAWGPFRAQCYTSDRWSVFEIVLSMVESLPAIFIMVLALNLLISNQNGGCVTLARKLGSIGLVLELGPVAKAGRQLVSWWWPVRPGSAAPSMDGDTAKLETIQVVDAIFPENCTSQEVLSETGKSHVSNLHSINPGNTPPDPSLSDPSARAEADLAAASAHVPLPPSPTSLSSSSTLKSGKS